MLRFCYMFFALSLFMGCSDGFKKDEDQSNSKEVIERANEDITVPEVERGPTPSAEIIIPPQDPAAPPPPGAGYSPPDPGNRGRGTLYKGGSQGHDKPKDTGNLDEPKKRRGPKAECGNGKVEVLPQENAKCPYLLYGVSNDQLYYISEKMGNGAKIAKISGVSHVTDVDFDPWGNLYGIGQDASSNIVYFKLNCETGEATDIKDTTIDAIAGNNLTDITIGPQGTVYAYHKVTGLSNDTLGTINRSSGVFTPIGLTGLDAIADKEGNGLGWAPLNDGQLYQADNTNLNTLDITTGLGSLAYALNFPHSIKDNNPRINGLDYDFFHGPMYATIQTDNGSFVGTVDLGSGKVEFLDVPPTNFEPNNLSGIAVNRVYEECDPADPDSIPEGAGCNEKCKLFETDCADLEDNDFNGLIDCSDRACKNEPCDDLNACTVGETCQNFECTGGENPCTDDNECTLDTCTPSTVPAVPPFTCSFPLNPDLTDFGDCEDDDDPCTLGKCAILEVDPQVIGCFEQPKVLIPQAQGGCEDGNPCTADSCLREIGLECIDNTSSNEEAEQFPIPTCGICEYEVLVNVPCTSDDNPCTQGTCVINGTGMPDDEFEHICEEVPVEGPYGDVCATGLPGICATGHFYCMIMDDEGMQVESICVPDIQPGDIPEIPDNNKDDDCDGQIDLAAFVSSTTYAGSIPEPEGVNVFSVDSADAECNRLATAVSLPGTYVAWLSTSTEDAITHLTGGVPTNANWYTVTGIPIAAGSGSDENGLTSGQLANPINVTENAVDDIDEPVWTGTSSSGMIVEGMTNEINCSDWTANGGVASGRVGDSSESNSSWTDTNSNEACNMINRIYCFQQPPAPPPLIE